MVLDSEPKVTGQDIELRIPASDKAGEFVPGVAMSAVAAVESAESVPVSVVSGAAVSGKIAKPAAETIETKPVEVKPAEAKQDEVKPAEVKKVEVKPVEVKKAEAKPVEVKKSEVKPADVKKAEVKPAEVKKTEARQTDNKPEEKLATGYIVQVGAFSNAGTASQEADKLKGWGFKAYTEQVNGTTRVRVGPYADRNKADEVRQLLEKHGQHPVITAVK
jgi:cell division septation protein DedD